MSLTFALTGLGEASIDNVSISLHEPIGPQGGLDEARRLPPTGEVWHQLHGALPGDAVAGPDHLAQRAPRQDVHQDRALGDAGPDMQVAGRVQPEARPSPPARLVTSNLTERKSAVPSSV